MLCYPYNSIVQLFCARWRKPMPIRAPHLAKESAADRLKITFPPEKKNNNNNNNNKFNAFLGAGIVCMPFIPLVFPRKDTHTRRPGITAVRNSLVVPPLSGVAAGFPTVCENKGRGFRRRNFKI
ncbi:uncharacterized protein TM35_000911030 [Trypanosoma theileri]|uniref:Uncharacterized protein n=1 Tax=Trypanosoma theileri TaxID=67003 RepID=A0A1X0NGE0_9TRYP|nr:uncharacterized protein TM35_000911030 [Trypanosoma theileri]ORC82372.1 hypothetical protein TM35_000911030 [Trypanosoma theileri]